MPELYENNNYHTKKTCNGKDRKRSSGIRVGMGGGRSSLLNQSIGKARFLKEKLDWSW